LSHDEERWGAAQPLEEPYASRLRTHPGCVLRVVYQQTNGLVGESFSLYDASRGRWHQSWFTNRGSLLLLDGGLEGDRMVLTGRKHGAAGGP